MADHKIETRTTITALAATSQSSPTGSITPPRSSTEVTLRVPTGSSATPLTQFRAALVAAAQAFSDPIATPTEKAEARHAVHPRLTTNSSGRRPFTPTTTLLHELLRWAWIPWAKLISFGLAFSKGSCSSAISPDRADARQTGEGPHRTCSPCSTTGCRNSRQPAAKRLPTKSLQGKDVDHRPQHGQLRARIRDQQRLDQKEPAPPGEPLAGSTHGRRGRG